MAASGANRLKAWGLAAAVFATALGIIAAYLPDRPAPDNLDQYWAQPANAGGGDSGPISGHEWSFDYQPIEGRVTALATTAASGLELNRQTLDRLNRIASALPQTLTEGDIRRIGFLSQQGLPAPIAEDVADTLVGFLRYRQAESRLQRADADGSNGMVSAQTRHERLVALQDRYIGESRAAKLFGQQRRLQRHLIERQAINTDPDLSAAQRRDALNRATERFRSEAGLEHPP